MYSEGDQRHMARALELARRGEGWVEPNPMVGCVIARGETVLAEGWHTAFGQPHAEAVALSKLSSPALARGATMYVNLEPCCHHGKTPPCVEAIVAAGIGRVVAAQADPFPQVNGAGIGSLRARGVAVDVGLLAEAARELNAPFLKRVTRGLPWVIAKWAMTLDGKIASRTGDSRWISNETSRAVVHQLRGRMDAILVGVQTALRDDPLLTARPAGPRRACRVVLDAQARLPPASQLATTAREWPVLVVVASTAPTEAVNDLRCAGCEVLPGPTDGGCVDLQWLLRELAARGHTNLLVEGGSRLLGSFFDGGFVDEVQVFVSPRVLGGASAPSAVAGTGQPDLNCGPSLRNPAFRVLDDNVLISGRVAHTAALLPEV